MTIGINATAAIKQPRTGVEEYAYQLIKHLTMLPEAKEHRFLLYLPAVVPLSGTEAGLPLARRDPNKVFDFELPENFEIKELRWSFPMWTQLRLMSHLAFHSPDVLFIPVHILPFAHPKNSVVTIHGLEYEYLPEYYPFWFRKYLRLSTKYAVGHARKIIAASENTKKDLIKFYGADESKISAVYHGVNVIPAKAGIQDSGFRLKAGMTINEPYLLYIGRIELKKNILGILEAYKILKEKYEIPHELVLVGQPGFGYDKIKSMIHDSKFAIHELGYVSEEEKWNLLRCAEVFLFPTFYEGFGFPVLEAQAAGAPVVASDISSVPEAAGQNALLVDPQNPDAIAQAVYKIIDDSSLRDKLIQSGFENVKRFSWEKCARKTLQILASQEK